VTSGQSQPFLLGAKANDAERQTAMRDWQVREGPTRSAGPMRRKSVAAPAGPAVVSRLLRSMIRCDDPQPENPAGGGLPRRNLGPPVVFAGPAKEFNEPGCSRSKFTEQCPDAGL
jgi:hypothetical protein